MGRGRGKRKKQLQKWREYEARKRQLTLKPISSPEYEQELQKITRELKI